MLHDREELYMGKPEFLQVFGELRGKPAGTIRITAPEHAVRALVWPRLLPWLPKYPDIKVEISSGNRLIDIVSERFDIGIRKFGVGRAADVVLTKNSWVHCCF